MKTALKIVVMLIIIGITIFWLNDRIAKYDMRFYSGKDDGVVARIESICYLSALFYSLVTEANRILMFLIGFIVGVLSSIVGYIISMYCFHNYGTIFHIIACVLFIVLFGLMYRFSSYTKQKIVWRPHPKNE